VENFGDRLISWYDRNKRDLPWRNSSDPYKIWLSEIILQQTRVDQGMDYYLRFVEKYPTVFEMASASEDEIFKLWQGLGYYNRAANMISTARTIVEKHNGVFPKNRDELLKLKGIGRRKRKESRYWRLLERRKMIEILALHPLRLVFSYYQILLKI